jgi:hypothetical protein
MATLTHPHAQSDRSIGISRVPVEQPLEWLRLGWDDLRHNPAASLAYGLIVSLFGALILALWSHPFFLAASISGFLLVGPLLGTGLVELSRRRERGEPVSFDASLSALGRHREALLRFSAGLLVIAALWFAASSIMLGIVLGKAAPAVGATLWGSLWDHVSIAQVLAYVGVGAILAAIVFELGGVGADDHRPWRRREDCRAHQSPRDPRGPAGDADLGVVPDAAGGGGLREPAGRDGRGFPAARPRELACVSGPGGVTRLE